MSKPFVSMNHVTKVFSGVTALSDIHFDVRLGEVHALLGENGAGKSTLMKILSGVYDPTSGEIVIEGSEFKKLTPQESTERGISIIYQELSLIDELSIAENIFVGRMPTKNLLGLKVIDSKIMAQRTRELLKKVGVQRDPTDIVGDLPISEKQMIEIVRAVAFDAKLIVMDEPTTSLTDEEITRLFAIVNQLKAENRSIVFISHKLNEVMEISDRITVLKDGAVIGTKPADTVTIDQLVTMMVGRELKDKYLNPHGHEAVDGQIILTAQGISRRDGVVRDVSFDVRSNEILGFFGLVGAGRTELMEAIYGATKRSAGTVTLGGKVLHSRTPYDSIKSGLAMVTEDRRKTGIFPNFDIADNIAIGDMVKTSSLGGLGGLVNKKRELMIAEQEQEAMKIKCRDLTQNITELSGGNQQKALLGRWLSTDAKVIIFDEPTKGIDVGTKAEIYTLMRELADQGIGIIVVSSEMPELLSISDRIAVMSEGTVTAIVASKDASEEVLLRAAVAEKEAAKA